MPPSFQHLFQHRAARVVAGIRAQVKSSLRIQEVPPTTDSSTCCIHSRAEWDSSSQISAFLDPFLVSSRLPLTMAVMVAAYSAYILMYPG